MAFINLTSRITADEYVSTIHNTIMESIHYQNLPITTDRLITLFNQSLRFYSTHMLVDLDRMDNCSLYQVTEDELITIRTYPLHQYLTEQYKERYGLTVETLTDYYQDWQSKHSN